MTWSYDSTDLSTDLNRVRLLIGDTNDSSPLLTNEEIAYYLSQKDNIFLAAADAVEYGILPKIARDIDRSNLGMSATRSQKSQQYRDLAKSLRAQAYTNAEVVSTAQSISDRTANEADTDLLQPIFERDQSRNPGNF